MFAARTWYGTTWWHRWDNLLERAARAAIPEILKLSNSRFPISQAAGESGGSLQASLNICMPPSTEVRAERLLTALAGVVSARAVADEFGRLCEIHVLASPELHPKQIVRNVESALSAGLGVIVDRRIISVAQLRANAARPAVSKQKRRARAAGGAGYRDQRLVYVKFDASSTSSLDTICYVTLRIGEDVVTGDGSGLNTVQGRADAAARAVFDALQRSGEILGLEGTTVVDTHGKSYVLVSARAVAGRTARLLTGTALLRNSPEEAAIMAALQATNRAPVL